VNELKKAYEALQQVQWPTNGGCPWTCDCDAGKFFRAAWEAMPELLALRIAAADAYDKLGYPSGENIESAFRGLAPFFPEEGP
jgi:hypothetical protein